MKQFFILAILAIFSLSTNAQVSKTDQQKQKKIDRHEQMLKLVASQTFILSANNLSAKFGYNWQVDPNTNFILIDSILGTVQYALPFSQYLGYNGLGGLTFDGKITSYEILDRGAGKGVGLEVSLFGTLPVDMFFDIADSGWANVTISGIHGGKLRMRGKIVDAGDASYFQGSLIY